MLLICMQSLANGCNGLHDEAVITQLLCLAMLSFDTVSLLLTHVQNQSTVLRWCQKAVIVKLQWVMSDPSYVNIASIRLDESTK